MLVKELIAELQKHDPEIDDEQTFEEHFEACKKTADKIHAVFIKAVV